MDWVFCYDHALQKKRFSFRCNSRNVVCKDIPEYVIVGGNPAIIIYERR